MNGTSWPQHRYWKGASGSWMDPVDALHCGRQLRIWRSSRRTRGKIGPQAVMTSRFSIEKTMDRRRHSQVPTINLRSFDIPLLVQISPVVSRAELCFTMTSPVSRERLHPMLLFSPGLAAKNRAVRSPSLSLPGYGDHALPVGATSVPKKLHSDRLIWTLTAKQYSLVNDSARIVM